MQPESMSLIMEYVPHGNLFKSIQQDSKGTLQWWDRGRHVALDIAKGLAYLHSRKVSSRPTPVSKPILAAVFLLAACEGCTGLHHHARSIPCLPCDSISLWLAVCSPAQKCNVQCATWSCTACKTHFKVQETLLAPYSSHSTQKQPRQVL